MSAWIVPKVHIDLLVRAAIHGGSYGDRFNFWQTGEDGEYRGWYELDEFAEQRTPNGSVTPITPSQLGQMLVNENVASVAHLYPDDNPDIGEQLPGPIDAYYIHPYVYENPGYTLTAAEVFKALDCYDYQSCEHDGWRKSDAFAFCRSLAYRYQHKVPGYEEAPWGFDQDFLEGKSLEFSRRII
jgi:hypothetical protein